MPRTILTHNDPAITIEVLDAPDAAGVCHEYVLSLPGPPVPWHEGVLARVAAAWLLRFHDGLTDAALLAVLRDRLEARQQGPARSADGDTALWCVTWALEALVGEAGDARIVTPQHDTDSSA